MKTNYTVLTIIFFLLFKNIHAQAPQVIPYQAVARDISGSLIVNQNISLRFSIHNASAGGTVVYKETQSATTNSLGLFTVNVGQGVVVTGTFSAVAWGSGTKYLQVEMDATGGVSYSDMGTQQMLSVPYALYAGGSSNGVPNGSANGNTLRWDGSAWVANALLSVTTSRIDISPKVVLGFATGGGQLVGFDDNHSIFQRTGIDLASNVTDICEFGDIRFYTNGALASQTQKMIIKQSGNVGIGTSSPAAKLHISASGTNDAIALIENTGGTNEARLEFKKAGSSNAAVGYYPGNSTLRLRTFEAGSDVVVEPNSVERMRISTNGNVGIGTAAPGKHIHVTGAGDQEIGIQSTDAGARLWTLQSNGNSAVTTFQIIDRTANVSRMGIDNNGNVGIGISTPANRLQVFANNSTNFSASIQNQFNSAGGNNGLQITAGNNGGTNFGNVLLFNRPDGATIGGVGQNTATTVLYGTTSDRRLKENIHNTKFSISDLNKIEVKDYDYINGTKNQTGFIAQQLFEIYPTAVIPGGEDSKTQPWMIDYGRITPLIIKSIQDQQKQIESKDAVIAQLQNEIEKVKTENISFKTDIEKIKAELGMDLKTQK